jgi:hypothetical protein
MKDKGCRMRTHPPLDLDMDSGLDPESMPKSKAGLRSNPAILFCFSETAAGYHIYIQAT